MNFVWRIYSLVSILGYFRVFSTTSWCGPSSICSSIFSLACSERYLLFGCSFLRLISSHFSALHSPSLVIHTHLLSFDYLFWVFQQFLWDSSLFSAAKWSAICKNQAISTWIAELSLSHLTWVLLKLICFSFLRLCSCTTIFPAADTWFCWLRWRLVGMNVVSVSQ